MTWATLTQLPSNAELLTILNGADFLSVAIRGHQCVETALTRVLSEALPAPHELEINRLTFSLKVDLAIALRLLPSESRSLFMAVNKIRNRFAHDPQATFDATESMDLWNAFSDFQKNLLGKSRDDLSTSQDVLARAIAVTFIQAKVSWNQARDHKIYAEVLHEMVEDTLKHCTGIPDKHSHQVDEELRQRFEQKKQRLREGPESDSSRG